MEYLFNGLDRFESDLGTIKKGIFKVTSGDLLSGQIEQTWNNIINAVKNESKKGPLSAAKIDKVLLNCDIYDVVMYFYKLEIVNEFRGIYKTTDDVLPGYQLEINQQVQIWQYKPRVEQELPKHLRFSGGTVPTLLMNLFDFSYREAMYFLYLGYKMDIK